MLVLNPVRVEPRMVLRTDTFARAVDALGTASFGRACLQVFEQYFDVDHWALFRYGPSRYVKCLTMASREHQVQAKRNVDLFVNRCHRVDPSLIAFKSEHTERPCLVKMDIADIDDRQYRHCFETTNVHERLSFFAADGRDLLQLCIYRAAANRTFSHAELRLFATLAHLVMAASGRHEAFMDNVASAHGRLDLEVLERRFDDVGAGLSKREVQVCARAVAGRTINDTAEALSIKKTSVITYRQRAYQKLGVSRQADLVALVCHVRSASDGVDSVSSTSGIPRVQ